MGRRALPTTRPLSGEPPRESHALLLTLGASAPSTHPFRGEATSYLDLGGQRVAGELKPDLVIPLKHTMGGFRSHRIRPVEGVRGRSSTGRPSMAPPGCSPRSTVGCLPTGSLLLNWVLQTRLKDEHWAFLEQAFCPGLEPGSP